MNDVRQTEDRPLPEDLLQVVREADAADRAAETLASGLTEGQFQWQPDAGGAWSIAQCLEHLASANRVYCAGMHAAIEDARRRGLRRQGPIAVGMIGRWFVRSLEPPVSRRYRSPTKIKPGPPRNKQEVLRLYREAHDTVRALASAAAEIDANRATFSNPFLPLIRVTVGTGFRVIAAHDRRHLWQAERVCAASGFPAATPR